MDRRHSLHSPPFQLAVFIVLSAVMLLARTHSLSASLHLPNTGYASFFVLGYFVHRAIGFAALVLLGFVVDVLIFSMFGGSGFCFTPGYWLLAPAHGVMWLGGRLAAARLDERPAALPSLAIALAGATFVANLLSSGGFYFLGGRYADPTIAGFLPRIARYFPGVLLASLLWTGVAAAIYAAIVAMRPDLRREPAR